MVRQFYLFSRSQYVLCSGMRRAVAWCMVVCAGREREVAWWYAHGSNVVHGGMRRA